MDDNTAISKKVQQQIQNFSNRICKGLSNPKKKFMAQVFFGIQASRDIKLSSISRSLNEKIKLIQTEKRLSRQLISQDITEIIQAPLIAESAWRIKEDTVLISPNSGTHHLFLLPPWFLWFQNPASKACLCNRLRRISYLCR